MSTPKIKNKQSKKLLHLLSKSVPKLRQEYQGRAKSIFDDALKGLTKNEKMLLLQEQELYVQIIQSKL